MVILRVLQVEGESQDAPKPVRVGSWLLLDAALDSTLPKSRDDAPCSSSDVPCLPTKSFLPYIGLSSNLVLVTDTAQPCPSAMTRSPVNLLQCLQSGRCRSQEHLLLHPWTRP